jgi:hypothetical protein
MNEIFQPKDSLRKWTCFVCGEEYENYEIYKDHIIATHEEGREYIKCPTCEAPVRDMKVHFDAKHPNRVMPKGIQTRVTIWKDFSGRKHKKPKFKTGHFESKKNNNALLLYRSGYEKEVYELLERDRDVTAYFAESFKVPYNFKGKWHDYVPDLKIQYADGSVEVWEIKPVTQKNLPRNKAKWAAMQAHAEAMGWMFTVITEEGMNKLKQRVQEQETMAVIKDINNGKNVS